MVMILKYGSANLMFLGSTALVPITNAVFAMSFMPGHKPMKVCKRIVLRSDLNFDSR